MPVFINEVVIRANVNDAGRPATTAAGAPATAPIDLEELVAQVMQSIFDQLERERDRIGER